jgi:S1-C subfamily serine protease
MSGLSLIADGNDLATFVVDEVKPASPAAKAGIVEGEGVAAVNGISYLTLRDFRCPLSQRGRI